MHNFLQSFTALILCSIMLFATTNTVCASTKQFQHLTVNIVGVDEETQKTLENNLTIFQATKEAKLSIIRIQNLHDLAISQLTETLETLGYYNATITHALNNNFTNWQATYTINLGKPIIIEQVNFVLTNMGAKDQKLLKKIKTPKLNKGDVLKHANYEDTKQALIIFLQEQGYLSAKFSKNEIDINKDAHTAKIFLTINTGKQYVFGDVKFIDCIYSTELLDRFVTFKKGDPYTSKALAKLRKNFTDSAMFKKIKISSKPNLTNPQDLVVPINVQLKHSPLNHYIGSLGYGTNTSFRGGIGWQHRFVSPSGHQLSSSLGVSKIRKQANINYLIPGQNPGTDRYIIGSGIQEDTIRDQFSQQKEVSLTKSIKQENLQKYLALKYMHEKFRFSPNMKNKRTKFLVPSAKFIWSKPHEEESTFTHGTKLEVTMQGGLGALLSATDFVQAEVLGKWIAPINPVTRFLLIGDVGATAIKNFNDLPLSMRFFGGGDKSVRGFAYHSIGPTQKDDDGNEVVVGGKYLIVTTVELERKIHGNLSAATFVDCGNVMNTWNSKFATGAGVGLRWATQIGAFKLDLAKQMTQMQGKKLRIHLTFGTDL